MRKPHGLRPTTVRVLDALVSAGDAAIGLTFGAISTELGIAERSVRRALQELEAGSYVRCGRTSGRHKYVASVGAPCSLQAMDARESATKTAQNGPKRPKAEIQNGPKRPKTAQPQASIEPPLKEKPSGGCKSTASRAAKAGLAMQPPQQLLVLEGSDTASDRHEVGKALQSLDQIVRGVWNSRGGRVHGFLCADDRTNIGLAAALRRYDWEVIASVVRWSAEQLADGRLKGALFATTFRGSGFDARHTAWEAHVVDQQRRAVAAAERAAGISHEPEADVMVDHGTAAELTAALFKRIGGVG